jgi:hypothetical protein
MATQIKIELQWLQAGFQGVLGTINTITSRFDEFNKKVNNGGAALQTAFQGALALFGVHALENYSEAAIHASRAQAQLEAALKSTGQYSAQYIEQLAEIAENTEKVTGTSALAVREIERILTQFGVGSKDMERFVMLTLDMAAAMGTDATSAAQRLGLILDGNADRIRGFTVQVDKTLPLAERLQSVADQLNRQVGGGAIAQFNATPKGLIQFELAVEQLKITLGTLYNSVVEPFFAALANGLNSTTAFWKRFNEQPNSFLKVARQISEWLGQLAGQAVTPIAIVIAALTLLTLAMKTFVGTRNIVAAFWYAFSGLGVEAINIVEARYLLFTSSLGTMVASWAGIIGSFFAGWNAGRFLGELKIGNSTLDQWIQVSFLGWSALFQSLVVITKSWWAEARALFKEGGAALELIVSSTVLTIAEYWNKIPGIKKIDTTGLEQSLIDANNRLSASAKEAEQIAKDRQAALSAIFRKTGEDVNSTLGRETPAQKAAAVAEQVRAQAAFSSELARIAREFAAKLLTLSAQAARDNTLAVIKNEEALYQQGLISFEQYMKARSASMRAQFGEDRAAINKEISVLSEQLKLKADELTRAKTEGKLAEATQLTKEKDDLALKLQQAKDQLRKLGRDNAQAQLDTQIQIRQHARDLAAARAGGAINTDELNVSRVEADPYLTEKERVQQLLPLLNEEIEKKQVLIDQLTERRDEAKDEQQKIDYQNQINALLGDQVQLQRKIKDLADSQSIVGSLKREWISFMDSVSSTSKDLADLIVSPFRGIQSGLESAFNTLFTQGANMRQFFGTVATSIEKSFVTSFAKMAANFITKSIAMMLQWAIMEIFQTQISTTESKKRRIESFKEGMTTAWKTAVKAADAVSGIPYVGPILAAVAFVGTLALLTAAAVFKDGGLVSGPGSGTSDSIMARVSNGEYILPASRVTPDLLPILEGLRNGALRAQDLGGVIAPRLSLAPAATGGNGAGGANVTVEGHRISMMMAHSRSEQVEFWRSAEGRKLFVELGRRHRLDIGIGT